MLESSGWLQSSRERNKMKKEIIEAKRATCYRKGEHALLPYWDGFNQPELEERLLEAIGWTKSELAPREASNIVACLSNRPNEKEQLRLLTAISYAVDRLRFLSTPEEREEAVDKLKKA